jgi:preprotein translocase SecE subunit
MHFMMMTVSLVPQLPPTDNINAGLGEMAHRNKARGLGSFLLGVKEEWHKITWPTQLQLLGQLLVVLVVVTVMTAFVWGLDTLFKWVIGLITPTV